MIAPVVRVAALTAVYLMFLTSVQPGDVLVGIALAVLVALAEARILGPDRRPSRLAAVITLRRLIGLPALVGFTLVDMCRGSWHVAAQCLGLRPTAPGFVTIPIRSPIRPNSPTSATAWAIRVGLSPDTVVVDVDDDQGTLVLHVLDARDPEAVIRDQTASYERAQRRAFP
jgi:multicomponent Na+:H+ antiporter subunit E